MFSVSVNSARLNSRLRDYAKVSRKSMADAVKEEAIFVAQRLVKLTPPAKAAEGRKRVAIDLGKVYVASKFFLETFQFRLATLGDRIKEAVRQRDTVGLESIFERSPKLRRLKLDGFTTADHERLRKDGRVPKNWKPGSFPLAQESQRKSYEKRKQQLVGLAKSGWGACVKALGRSVSAWFDKSGTGSIRHNLQSPTAPSVTLRNNVPYMASLDGRKGIVNRALEGRTRDLGTKIERALREAARQAALT